MGKWIAANPMTFMLGIVFIIVAVVGGILVAAHSAAGLTFDEYCSDLSKFAVGIGILGAGKAVKNGMMGGTDTGTLPVATDQFPDYSGEPDVPYDSATEPAPVTESARAFPPGLQP